MNIVTLVMPADPFGGSRRFAPGLTPSRLIIARAAKFAEITVAELTGQGRAQHVSRVRFAVMRTLRARGLSSPRIGALLGNRDHTTILSGLKRAEALYRSDVSFADLCDAVAA